MSEKIDMAKIMLDRTSIENILVRLVHAEVIMVQLSEIDSENAEVYETLLKPITEFFENLLHESEFKPYTKDELLKMGKVMGNKQPTITAPASRV
jgi:hypothetical protein